MHALRRLSRAQLSRLRVPAPAASRLSSSVTQAFAVPANVSAPPTCQKNLTKLLKASRGDEDIKAWLAAYGDGKRQLAVLKVGGGCISDTLPLLVENIRLLRDAGLYPLIVHGAGPQLNKLIEETGEEPVYRDGMRVTTPTVLEVVRMVFAQENAKLVAALVEAGVDAQPITGGVFEAEMIDHETYGLVGKVTRVKSFPVLASLKLGRVPVMTSLGESAQGQLLNINADIAANALAKEVQPFKLMFINTTGGLLDNNKRVIPKINMATDFDRLMGLDWVKYGFRLKLKEFNVLLDDLPQGSSISVTSVEDMPFDMFGPPPNGTLVVKDGSAPSTVSPHAIQARTNARKIGIIGARGHVGLETIRLLDRHAGVEIAHLGSRALSGQPVTEVVSGISSRYENLKFTDIGPENIAKYDDVDAWILSLPNNLSEPFVEALKANPKVVLVDLSADHRFDDTWQYGLPERFRDNIRKHTRIANPGCYATGGQLAILPVAHMLAGKPHVFGVSGYSGAGTAPSDKNDPENLRDNIIPYSLTNHIHEREVSRQVGHPVCFYPHVGQFFQGISLTVSIPLVEGLTHGAALELYQSYYRGEPLVRVMDGIPLVARNARKHHACVGGFVASASGEHLVVVATLDNLLKGAATQCVQNLNLALGLDELDSIRQSLDGGGSEL